MAREYTKELFTFYSEEDKDIIQAIRNAKANGISKREFIIDLYKNKQSAESSVSLEEVKDILYAYRIPGNIVRNVVNSLGGN